jgi:hypothetical protein
VPLIGTHVELSPPHFPHMSANKIRIYLLLGLLHPAYEGIQRFNNTKHYAPICTAHLTIKPELSVTNTVTTFLQTTALLHFTAYFLLPRCGIRSTRGLGPTTTARGQSIGILIGMLPQTLIMSTLDQLSRLGAQKLVFSLFIKYFPVCGQQFV